MGQHASSREAVPSRERRAERPVRDQRAGYYVSCSSSRAGCSPATRAPTRSRTALLRQFSETTFHAVPGGRVIVYDVSAEEPILIAVLVVVLIVVLVQELT